ncbi:MAG: VCBS repeat-containing protein, partial [Candidatus Sulfotelmatobacter sp.]
LAVANAGSNTITVLLGAGNGNFAPPISPAVATDPVYAAVGDFNGDGVPDLAAASNTTNSVTMLLTRRTSTAAVNAKGP